MNSTIIIAHGSKSESANKAFTELIARTASRSANTRVNGAFLNESDNGAFKIAENEIANGATKIVLLPYFLSAGNHVTKDVENIYTELTRKYPEIEIKLQPCLEGEPLLEDILYERIAAELTEPEDLPILGSDIEGLSHEIIDKRLAFSDFPKEESIVARRIIHATADFSFAKSLSFHPEAIARGVAAIKEKKPIICDVNMLRNGVTRTASQVICAISDDDVIEAAKADGTTRAAASMKKLAHLMDGAIVAVGNAPTAIWQLLQMDVHPALIIGLPVGFVGARESKVALIESHYCHIANTSPRGGSPAAAAALNALGLLAREHS